MSHIICEIITYSNYVYMKINTLEIFQQHGGVGPGGHLALKLVDLMGNRYVIEDAYSFRRLWM